MSEGKKDTLKPLLLTRNELRLIIHWKKNCDDSSCPLYSMEGGNAFCESVIEKLVDAFNEWKEEEKIENA